MSKTIVIDPVTRIEGHAKITIQLNESGDVDSTRFHVTEFRGFEKFLEGRPVWEMPGITARICGICPVSHLLASAKTGDNILAVKIPAAAVKLRRMMNLAQFTQSHALSFFHLSSPDFLLGFDSNPATRNVFGLMAANPELARAGIRLRKWGQDLIAEMGGKKVHPAWAVPGGVRNAITPAARDKFLATLPEARATTLEGLRICKKLLEDFPAEAATFGNFKSLFMSLVTPEGGWEHYDGVLRFVDATGNVVADGLDPARFKDHIGEAVESWSYLKFPYYKPLGYPNGIYRVGPMARLMCAEQMGTPMADAELKQFKHLNKTLRGSSFLYHYARLIEILAASERIEQLLQDPDIVSDRYIRADAGVNAFDAVGVTEAPRGTLFHHYQVDDDGLVTKANLIVATGHNNLAMNKTVEQIAKHFVKGPKIAEGMLNRVEAGIRCYDPCLSCSTHAAGQMPLHIQLVGANGEVLDEVKRG